MNSRLDYAASAKDIRHPHLVAASYDASQSQGPAAKKSVIPFGANRGRERFPIRATATSAQLTSD